MCGIFGVVDFSSESSEKFINEIFDIGMHEIKHRGPDETISFSPFKGVKIGMQRLSIINLNENLYPIVSKTNDVVSVFNGEIYNYKELNMDANYIGNSQETLTDASSLSNGFEVDKIQYLNKLSGMFSIAFWTLSESKLTLVRDIQGIKPLYYFYSRDLLIFSSEPKAIYALKKNDTFKNKFNFTLNRQAIMYLSKYMYLPQTTESFANEIKQIPPGGVFHFSKKSIVTEKIFHVNSRKLLSNKDFVEVANLVEKELVNAVGRHLNSDAKICLALSGGIDSSLLANISDLDWNTKLDAFSISFIKDRRSENLTAKKIADMHCNSFTNVEIDTNQLLKDFDEFLPLFYNLSTLDGGLISNTIMANMMKSRGFKVAIYGEGADELFGGYTWFQLKRGTYSALSSKINFSLFKYAISRDKFTFDDNLLYPKIGESFAESLRHFELNNQLPQHLLKKIDNATMFTSVEGRVPYLDSILLSNTYLLTKPFLSTRPRFGIFPDSSRTKPVLRYIYRKRFNSNTTPSKKGFQLPLDYLVLNYLAEIKDLASSSNSITKNVLNSQVLKRIVKITSKEISVENVWLLWRLLILEKWNQDFWLK